MTVDFEQYIISKDWKAKGLVTYTAPNWDLEFRFKIWRKKHAIKLDNLKYEEIQADINQREDNKWLLEYHTKIRESHAKITKIYADRIKIYNEEVWNKTDTFMKEAIDNYFTNLD